MKIPQRTMAILVIFLFGFIVNSNSVRAISKDYSPPIQLKAKGLKRIGSVSESYHSYNVEMVEVVG